MPLAVVRDRVEQRHQHARHLFGLLVSWFTFFVTLNYVTIGWFVSKPEANKPGRVTLMIGLAAIFASQIALGIGAELVFLAYLRQTRARIREYEAMRVANGIQYATDSCLPFTLYSQSVSLMIAALGVLLLAWLALLVTTVNVVVTPR